MKNNIIAIVTLVSSVFSSYGQEEASKNYFIGVSGGYSNLSGNLIKNDYADSSSGYAYSNGLNFGLEGGYFLKKNFGIAAVISTSSFSSNGLQTLSDGYQEDFEVDSITLTASGKYSTYNFFVGPIFSYPKGKFTFNAKVLGGLVYAVTPEYKVDIEDQLDATFYQRSASAATFGVQTGLSISYALTANLGLKIGVDYTYSKPNFSITNENRDVNVGRKITEYNQVFSTFNSNVGIIYSFGK
jgi:hypothetical protein